MPTFWYRDADEVDRAHPVGLDPILIGRAVECQIQSQDPRVSRRHARVFVEEGAYLIEDLGSSNGVFVDGVRVTRAPITGGAMLLVGSLRCWLAADEAALEEATTLPSPETPDPVPPAPTPPLARRPDPTPVSSAAVVGGQAALIAELEAALVARRYAEEERDVLGQRLGELHRELQTVKSAAAAEDTARTTRLAAAEREGAALHQEVGELRKDHAGLGMRVSTLESENKALAAAKAELETECRTLANATRESEVADEARRAEMDTLRDQLAGARIERDKVKVARDQLADENPSLASAKAAAEKDAAAQRTEAAALRERVTALESDIGRFREAADQAGDRESAQMTAINAQATGLRKSLDDAKAELAERDATLAEARDGALREVTELRSADQARRTETDALRDQLAASRIEHEKLEASHDHDATALRERVTALESDIARSREAADQVGDRENAQMTAINAQAAELRKSLEDAKAELAERDATLAEARDAALREVTELRSADQAQRAETDALRDQLAAARIERDKLEASHGQLAEAGDRDSAQMAAVNAQATELRKSLEDAKGQLAERDATLAEARDAALRETVELRSAEQARRAETDAVRDELAAARSEREKLVASHDHDATALRERVTALESDLARSREAADQVGDRENAQMTAINAQAAELRKSLEDAKAQVASRDAALAEARDAAQVERDALKSAQEQLTAANQSSGAAREAAEKDAAASRERVIALESEIARLREAADHAGDRQSAQMTVEREAALHEVATLRDAHVELGLRVSALETENKTLAAHKAELERECQTIADATRASESADQALRAEMDALRDQLAGARIERDKIKIAHEAGSRGAVEDRQAAEVALRAEAERADSERSMRRSAEEERDHLRSQLEAKVAMPAVAEAPPAPALPPSKAAGDTVAALEDALAELRASLRAANDETAGMTEPQSSVQVLTEALGQATERLEIARDAARALAKLFAG